jgi:hypothetical protein
LSDGQTTVAVSKLTMSKAKRCDLMLLWGSLFTLVVADGVITEFLISRRFAWESNPFLAGLVGDSGFLALKAFGATLAILILWDVSKRHYRIALAITCFFVFIYAVIVFWNLFVFYLGSV